MLRMDVQERDMKRVTLCDLASCVKALQLTKGYMDQTSCSCQPTPADG